MNEKRLIGKLKNEASYKAITHNTISEMLLLKNIRSLVKLKKITTVIQENYDTILNGACEGYLSLIISSLYEYPDMVSFLDKNLIKNLKKCQNYEASRILEAVLKDKSDTERVQFLEDNIDDILDNIDIYYIHDFFYLKNFSSSIYNKLNKYLENNKESYVKTFYKKVEPSSGNMNSVYSITEDILDELLKHENKNYVDIEYIGKGSFSDVLLIGSKVLKIGSKRVTYNIPYDKRILQPLIRVNLSDLTNNRVNAVIEVEEKVDTSVNLDNDGLYFFYRDMRQRGIICSDLKCENIGRLLKDNKKYYENIADDKKAVGFNDYNGSEDVLKKGDLVLLDTDFLYLEGSENISWGNFLSEQFEKRYKKEISDSDLFFFEEKKKENEEYKYK